MRRRIGQDGTQHIVVTAPAARKASVLKIIAKRAELLDEPDPLRPRNFLGQQAQLPSNAVIALVPDKRQVRQREAEGTSVQLLRCSARRCARLHPSRQLVP
jgi:hypothetical protein